MFVVTLSYTAPIEQVDALLLDHRAWLDEQYANGVLLASGAKVPRTGGVLLAGGLDRGTLDQVLAEDPFAKGGVAQYDVVEFTATKTAECLADYREQPAS
ncbi:YciI family protein [Streptacidiphilus neutrinimicus]|uniref:YciI family protein n=1 Tax=Streptacidiphilus neutrinimicus TaxID=105420 RepID=UPI0005A81EB6|nr:YciI family protein [Streptacidiphilus neutrinimicus]